MCEITGFQASMIGMNYVTRWMTIKGPWKQVQFEKMLYPQYADKFEKTIDQDTFDYLQTQAKTKLSEADNVSKEVVKHWTSIVSGVVQFGYRLGEA